MPEEKKIFCFKCQNAWSVGIPVPRKEECPSCMQDARVCLNCKFYSKNSYRECKESQSSWVKDKEKSNYCDYFFPGVNNVPSSDGKENYREKLDNLFGSSKDCDDRQNKMNLNKNLDDFFRKK